MNREALQTVIAFTKLPKTEETEHIKHLYLNNEISYYELYCLARDYLDKSQIKEVLK